MTNLSEEYTRKFQERLDAYSRDYRIDELNQSNDLAQLRMLINAELMLEALQTEVDSIIDGGNVIEKASEFKKLSDLRRDAVEDVIKIQRTLAIDRKTRKAEETDNFAGWLRNLKREASKFVDDRLIKLYCPDCKVLAGRWSPVHKHTGFKVMVQCSQCGKAVTAQREDRDVWFDLKKDAAWRKKYPVEIDNPSAKEGFSPDAFSAVVEDEFILDGGEVIDGFGQTPRE